VNLPTLLTVGTIEGIAAFVLLLAVRWRRRSSRLDYEDILNLSIEVILLVGSTTAGIQAFYFGATGNMYPGSSQFEFGPQIMITGLTLIVAPPILLYQRLKPKKTRRARRPILPTSPSPSGTAS